jgi:hypothetical protein
MSYPERIKSYLWDDIYEMSRSPELFAKDPGIDFTRKRKLCFEELLRFLICKQSSTTAYELLKHFGQSTEAITISAFYQQRQKLSLNALPHLFYQFNSHFPLKRYKDKYNLVACDGCEFNIFRDPNDPTTFNPPNNKSSRGFNTMHTVPLYDILNKRYLDCVIQPGRNKNEFQAFCDLVDRYPYEGTPIFIADRGFASYNAVAHALEKGVLFLIRSKDVNTKRLLALDGLSDLIDTDAHVILSRTQSKKKRKHPELEEQYRHICSNVKFDFIEPGSYDEYPLSLRVVRIETAPGCFANFYTNLPADEFPVDEIRDLYHARWGIETSFRDLKHTIGATEFHSRIPEYIAQEIWARLILFNFCSIITMHVVIDQGDTKYIYQVNFAMAMRICHDFIMHQDNKSPPDVEGLIRRYKLPIRPDRNFARQHRFRFPASFCYRLA